MTLEERADLIASANSTQQPGGRAWTKVRERALRQLREIAADSWRHGFDAGVAADRDLSPRSPPVFLGLGVEER